MDFNIKTDAKMFAKYDQTKNRTPEIKASEEFYL